MTIQLPCSCSQVYTFPPYPLPNSNSVPLRPPACPVSAAPPPTPPAAGPTPSPCARSPAPARACPGAPNRCASPAPARHEERRSRSAPAALTPSGSHRTSGPACGTRVPRPHAPPRTARRRPRLRRRQPSCLSHRLSVRGWRRRYWLLWAGERRAVVGPGRSRECGRGRRSCRGILCRSSCPWRAGGWRSSGKVSDWRGERAPVPPRMTCPRGLRYTRQK